MKILVVSDTHNDTRNFYVALERESPVDMVIHCGDICGYDAEFSDSCKCPFYAVMGNMDLGASLPHELVLDVPGHRIYVTHGHRQYVGCDTTGVVDAAKAQKADIALYGHTHIPELSDERNMTVICPGSLSYPRQKGKRASYAVMTFDKKGKTFLSAWVSSSILKSQLERLSKKKAMPGRNNSRRRHPLS